jgi:hypothetical protein
MMLHKWRMVSHRARRSELPEIRRGGQKIQKIPEFRRRVVCGQGLCQGEGMILEGVKHRRGAEDAETKEA